MDLFFGYIAGVLTLLNPCVLPVLPVVLIAALNSHKLGPLSLCAGLSATFVVVGLFVAALGPALGIDDTLISQIASVMMIAFGLVLLVPVLSQRFTLVASGASNALAAKTTGVSNEGLGAQFLTGALLGAVWTPCIGPTLGGAIALASQGNNFIWAALTMLAFALGVSTMILALAALSREALFRHRQTLQSMSQWARPVMGILLVAIGLFILLGLQYSIEIWAVETLPYWFQDLSIRY